MRVQQYGESLMAGPKTEQSFEVNEDHLSWLQEMTGKYALADVQKALRIVLDYCIEEGDKDHIFKKVRCRRCG